MECKATAVIHGEITKRIADNNTYLINVSIVTGGTGSV